jgi:prolyl 4-hydroxylase
MSQSSQLSDEAPRRSSRKPADKQIPHRHAQLFHSESPTPGNKKLELMHTNPNIYFVRNFLNESEIALMDKICTYKKGKFNSSFVENDDNEEVISELRTSKYVYVNKAHSSEIRAVEERAATLCGLDSSGVEPLQIVSYTQGQKFETHHDAGTLLDDGTVEAVPPRRLTTLFLYLNTLPEGQGHTEFPALGLSVKPERGCGVLFSNVMGDGRVDARTQHRAAPVHGRLQKYGVNVWITDSNFQDLAAGPGIKGAVTKKELKDFYAKHRIAASSTRDNINSNGGCEDGTTKVVESALQCADRLTREYSETSTGSGVGVGGKRKKGGGGAENSSGMPPQRKKQAA